jgi:hypothetical protein
MTNETGANAPNGYATMTDAIKLSGIAKSTFYEYLNKGTISSSLVNFKGKERKFIQHSEILRVFGKLHGGQTEQNEVIQNLSASTDDSELVRLRIELEKVRTEKDGLAEVLKEVRATKESLEKDKALFADMLKDANERVKLLEYRPGDQDKKKSSWLSRLFGQ